MRPSTKLVLTERLDDGRTVEIFMVKPALTFVAKCGDFTADGSTKNAVMTRIKELAGTPLLEWTPVIQYRYSFGREAMELKLARFYVAKGPKGWLEAGAGVVVGAEIVLDDSVTRDNNLRELPGALTDEQRKALLAASHSCHLIGPGGGLDSGVYAKTRDSATGIIPFDKGLWQRLLVLQDCIHRAGGEIAKLLNNADGIARLLGTIMPLALEFNLGEEKK
jgi:hypothetical protein